MTLWDFGAEGLAEVDELLPPLPESSYPPGAVELVPLDAVDGLVKEDQGPPEVVPGQSMLFGSDDEFTVAGQEWKGMPEFAQADLTSWKAIIVHLEDRAALDAFAKVVGQRLTTRTRSIWYPEAEIGHFIDKRYRDLNAEAEGES